MDFFSAPEFWLFLGVLLGGWFFMTEARQRRKQLAARISRVTRKAAPMASAAAAQSLRRQTPGSDGMFGELFGSMRSIEKLRGRLEMAGLSQTSPQQFLATIAGVALGATLLLLLFWGKPLLVCLPIGVLIGLGLPHMVIGHKIKKRQRAFLTLFPDAIELMVRGLKAGLPVAESFINVSRELPPPMGDLFATISQQTQLGVTMEKALVDAAGRLKVTEFDFFVTTIILQRETGGNLGEILTNLADMLRQRHMMKMKIGALSSEARASAYIIGSLPFLVFCILQVVSPAYLTPLFEDPRGNNALMGAIASLSMGAFIMHRMTQLEI